MAALFDETLFDPTLFRVRDGRPPMQGSPELANTKITNQATGISKINVNRYDAIEKLTADAGTLDAADLEYLLKMWRGGYGNAVGFRFRITHDFYVIDQTFGTGNGSRTTWTLYKGYTRPGVSRTDVRYIVKPVMDTVARLTNLGGAGGSVRLYEANGQTARVIPSTLAASLNVPAFTIKINNVVTTAYTVNNTTGLVTFNSAPANGAVLSWSGEFDTPMRFSGNSLPLTRIDLGSEAQGVHFEEILYEELGITVV